MRSFRDILGVATSAVARWIQSAGLLLLSLFVTNCAGILYEVNTGSKTSDNSSSGNSSSNQNTTSELRWNSVSQNDWPERQVVLQDVTTQNSSCTFEAMTTLEVGLVPLGVTNLINGPDSNLYSFIPGSSNVYKFNPNTETGSTINIGVTTPSVHDSFGSTLALNGKFYATSGAGGPVTEFDPITLSATQFGTTPADFHIAGIVVAGNGMIYGIPFSGGNDILKIDPVNHTLSTIPAGDHGWGAPILAPNGKIYATPIHATSILKFDPDTETVTTLGSFSSSQWKWRGSAIAPSGIIYATPFWVDSVLKIDPTSDTVTEIPLGTETRDQLDAVLAPNGFIYSFSAYPGGKALRIDPATDTLTSIDLPTGSHNWAQGVVASNGMIYGHGWNFEDSLLKMDISLFRAFPEVIYLAPQFNR